MPKCIDCLEYRFLSEFPDARTGVCKYCKAVHVICHLRAGIPMCSSFELTEAPLPSTRQGGQHAPPMPVGR